MRKMFGLMLALVLMFFMSPAVSGELTERELINANVRTMFATNDFEGLENLAENYRTTEARTSSGLWKLTLYYYVLNDIARIDIKDESFWDGLLSKTDRWLALYPQSPTAQVAKGVMLARYAWKFRGGGYAKSVAPENWNPFYNNLQIAREHMLRYEDAGVTDPHWYVIQLDILNAMGAQKDVFTATLEEGLERYPGYYQMYFVAVEFYAPKWGGNDAQIRAFADASVDRTRDIEGDGMYARIFWYASQTQYGRRLFLESDVVWDNMRDGIFDGLSRYPAQWNVQNFALFACYAGDFDTTDRLADMIQGAPIVSVWRNAETFDICTGS